MKTDYPAVVIAPQCPEDKEWTDKSMLNSLSILMEEASQHERIDRNRIYLMGSSMGSAGSYSLLMKQPDLFAGAVIICGWTLNDFKPEELAKTSVWVFMRKMMTLFLWNIPEMQ